MNIRNSFPEKSEKEVKKIARKFYAHFTDLMFESIKNFDVSAEEIVSRCKVKNPEVLDQIYAKGRNAILVAGHYANWENAAVSFDLQFKHQMAGIYAPLSNKFLDTKFYKSRGKYGMGLVSRYEVPQFFKKKHEKLTTMIFVADQSPAMPKKNTYWTNFLNQDTAVFFGVEKYAVDLDWPVLFADIHKVKRGRYEVEITLLEEHPQSTEKYTVTEKHVRALEEQILRRPEHYLWTHKRWKHKRKVD